MQCPKCSADMEIIDFKGIEIDRCSRCRGIWFDRLERETLHDLEGAEDLDIGFEDPSEEYNEMVFVECPKCFSILGQAEQDETNVKYEICRSCHGSFFDAGEFRTYLTTAAK